MLRPQDVIVAVQIRSYGLRSPEGVSWTYTRLADDTGLSASQGHASVSRLKGAGLVLSEEGEPLRVPQKRLGDLLQHAAPLWLYPESTGSPGVARGVPTAWSAPPLSGVMKARQAFVWPHPMGEQSGQAVKPLHHCVMKGPCVPGHAQYNEDLHQVLALVDALRLGRARERREATRFLAEWGYLR